MRAGTKLAAFGFVGKREGQFSAIDVARRRDIGARQCRSTGAVGGAESEGELFSVSRRKGDEELSDGTGSDPRRATGNRESKRISKPKVPGTGNPARSKPPAKSANDVGKALRSVYDATLGERVPDDFLDLLGKLS